MKGVVASAEPFVGSEPAVSFFGDGVVDLHAEVHADDDDVHVEAEPDSPVGRDAVPGEALFLAGAFVQGSSIELSADGPLRAPYNVYFQGGLTWPHAKLGILRTVQNFLDRGLINL